MIDVLHLHGFKCAGTTFASILHNNYGALVGYIESESGGRLPWQVLSSHLDLPTLKAVSSHLITLPEPAAGLAAMHVAFVREPRERLKSAYRFQRRTGSLKSTDIDFEAFIERVKRTTLANYQTRQLSPQDQGGWHQRKGWQLRPDLIALGREDLFVGTVERFDESLVLLELRLRESGIEFDASYADASNTSKQDYETLHGIPLEVVELDEILHQRVDTHLTEQIKRCPGFAHYLEDFRQRCESRRSDLSTIIPPGPAEWTYVKESTWAP